MGLPASTPVRNITSDGEAPPAPSSTARRRAAEVGNSEGHGSLEGSRILEGRTNRKAGDLRHGGIAQRRISK